jgi:hypothetical protein
LPIRLLRYGFSRSVSGTICPYSLDEPVPSFPPSDKMQGHAVNLARMSKKHNLTLRQLRDYASAAQGHCLIWGTPERIADQLQEWFDADAADGFIMRLMRSWIGSYRYFRSAVFFELSMNPPHFGAPGSVAPYSCGGGTI